MGAKESIKTKRNTLLRGGRNFRLNFVDPFYDFFPQFYTGPLGILGFDINQLGMHSVINEPFPLNYDFFPGLFALITCSISLLVVMVT